MHHGTDRLPRWTATIDGIKKEVKARVASPIQLVEKAKERRADAMLDAVLERLRKIDKIASPKSDSKKSSNKDQPSNSGASAPGQEVAPDTVA